MLVLVGILFIVVGMFLPRLKRNTSMGLRTPWTMASDLSWTMIRRLAGRLFVAPGHARMLGVFVDNTAIMVWTVIGGTIETFFVSGDLLVSRVVVRAAPEPPI